MKRTVICTRCGSPCRVFLSLQEGGPLADLTSPPAYYCPDCRERYREFGRERHPREHAGARREFAMLETK